MNNFVELLDIPGLEQSRIGRAGRRLIMLALGMKALNGLLSGGSNDHCRDYLCRHRNCYVRTSRVAFDVEVHHGSRVLRLWWHLRGDLCL